VRVSKSTASSPTIGWCRRFVPNVRRKTRCSDHQRRNSGLASETETLDRTACQVLPVEEEVLGVVGEEHPARIVPLPCRHLLEVDEERTGQAVARQDVCPLAQEERGLGVEGVEELVEPGTDALHCGAAPWPRVAGDEAIASMTCVEGTIRRPCSKRV
jgi:hypothetical protein